MNLIDQWKEQFTATDLSGELYLKNTNIDEHLAFLEKARAAGYEEGARMQAHLDAGVTEGKECNREATPKFQNR